MAIFSEIRPITLREQIIDQVRTAIIEGRLKPNDHVTEMALTKQLRVSRTPVREALIVLERERLVVFAPNRGYFVRVFTEKDIHEIFSLRIALENLAAEIATHRLNEKDYNHLHQLIERQAVAIKREDKKGIRSIDMNFHRYLIEASSHDLLIQSWNSIVAQIAALLYIRAEADPDYDENQVIKDHEAILGAYQSGDAAEVARINRQINERVARNCVEALHHMEGQ
jgi:DNA-binding GntR family transcriptional regulator